MPNDVDRARTLLLNWLRNAHRDPSFDEHCGTLTESFIELAAKAQFNLEVVPVDADPTSFVIHWTHRGASFVGFKQPAPEAKMEDALLVGCAALLENDWCRKQLPQ